MYQITDWKSDMMTLVRGETEINRDMMMALIRNDHLSRGFNNVMLDLQA